MQKTLSLSDQTSADNSVTVEQPNLAIKGIIAIKAMAFISSSMNMQSDFDNYNSQASSLYGQWNSMGVVGNTMLASFNSNQSWSSGYNLFADRWLGTGAVTDIDEISDQTVQTALQSGAGTYGINVDSLASSDGTVLSSWNMFTAGSVSSTSVQANIFDKLVSRANLNIPQGPFPLVYNGSSGVFVAGVTSPAQAAAFALLAPMIPVLGHFQAATTSSLKSSRRSHVGSIIGGAIGGFAGLAGIFAFFFRHYDRQKRTKPGLFSSRDFSCSRELETLLNVAEGNPTNAHNIRRQLHSTGFIEPFPPPLMVGPLMYPIWTRNSSQKPVARTGSLTTITCCTGRIYIR